MTYVQVTSGNSTSIGSSNTQAKPNGTVANCSVGVNVRDTNSTQGKLLTTIAVNSRVAITKLKDGWGFVDGKGWVYMQYVKLDAGAEEAIKNALKDYYDRAGLPYDEKDFPDCEHCEHCE